MLAVLCLNVDNILTCWHSVASLNVENIENNDAKSCIRHAHVMSHGHTTYASPAQLPNSLSTHSHARMIHARMIHTHTRSATTVLVALVLPKCCSSCAGFGRLNVGICLMLITPRDVGRTVATSLVNLSEGGGRE